MIRHNILNDGIAASQFFTGVQRLKDPTLSPWPGQPGLSMYDFFVFWHHQAMMTPTPPGQIPTGPGDRARNAAHVGPVFLPWHRYMLLMLEFYLRDTLGDPNFRIPYWDWAGDAALPNPALSTIWTNPMLGQFVGPGWRVRIAMNLATGDLQATNRGLGRNLGAGGRLAPRNELRDLVRDVAIYDVFPYDETSLRFRNLLEGWRGPGHHNAVHGWVGGDMELSTSPNDPVFFLHHANIDRVWAAWQQAHPASNYQPPQTESPDLLFHRIDDAMHTYFNHGFDITPRLMLDYTGYYQYDTLSDLL